MATTKIIRKYRAHVGRVNVVRFNLDESNIIISGSIDGRVKLWDLRSKSYEHLQEIDDCKDSVTYLDLNLNQILVSCLDKHTRLFDIRMGKLTSDYIGVPVTCSTLSKDDQCILVSVLDNKLLIFDKQSGELLNEYSGHRNKLYNLENCMNQNCDLIMSGSEDGCVYAWDVVDSKIKFKLKHANDKTVPCLSYHPEEKKLLSSQENHIYLWVDNEIKL